LRAILAEEGIDVSQSTLSRDLRRLGVVRRSDAAGAYYVLSGPGKTTPAPELRRLVPHLLVRVDRAGHLLVLKTLVGSAHPIAAAVDDAGWSEVLGTIAGDDTVLVIVRDADQAEEIAARIEAFAD
jgi:transcriptional regulator of arginine metabolism